MNEAGPVAVYDPAASGHVLLQPRMWVEPLDAEGRAVVAGERGEVTLTGGFNFCLPLIRYRTGDFASLGWVRDEPVLLGLSGRPPVRFRTSSGEWINNIDVTHALQPFAIPQYTLHQAPTAALRLPLDRRARERGRIVRTLPQVFGDLSGGVDERVEFEDKVFAKHSVFPGARA